MPSFPMRPVAASRVGPVARKLQLEAEHLFIVRLLVPEVPPHWATKYSDGDAVKENPATPADPEATVMGLPQLPADVG